MTKIVQSRSVPIFSYLISCYFYQNINKCTLFPCQFWTHIYSLYLRIDKRLVYALFCSLNIRRRHYSQLQYWFNCKAQTRSRFDTIKKLIASLHLKFKRLFCYILGYIKNKTQASVLCYSFTLFLAVILVSGEHCK